MHSWVPLENHKFSVFCCSFSFLVSVVSGSIGFLGVYRELPNSNYGAKDGKIWKIGKNCLQTTVNFHKFKPYMQKQKVENTDI